MACDPATLLEQAKCVQTCIPPGMMAAAGVAALCQLAGGSSGAPYVLKAGDTMNQGPLVLDLPAYLDSEFVWAHFTNATGNAAGVALELYHEVSGGAGGGAISGGVAMDFRCDSDTVDRQAQVRIQSEWTIAANATRTAQLRIIVCNNADTTGNAECLRLSMSGVDLRNNAPLQMGGVAYFNPQTVFASGTIYTLTAASAAVDFGTTDPIITLTAAGSYVIRARVKLNLNGATFAANQTVTVKLRRTNNTPADIANSSTTWTVPIVTTATSTLDVITTPEVIYSTALTTDTIQIFADVSVLPSAGSIQIAEASILAFRITNT